MGMAIDRGTERMGGPEHDFLELLFVCLATGEARVIKAPPMMTLASIVQEWFERFYRHTEGVWLTFDLNRMRFIIDADAMTPRQSGLSAGDTVLIDSMDGLLGDLRGFEEPTALTVDSFEQAIERVAGFSQTGYVPQFFTCELSEEQFSAIVSRAIRDSNRVGGDERFGGPKLLGDLMISADREYARRIHEPVRYLVHRIWESLMHSNDCSSLEALRRFDDIFIFGMQEGRTCGRRVHLIYNAAALHVEPAPYAPDALVELVKAGELRVGDVRVNSEQHFAARAIILPEGDPPDEPTPGVAFDEITSTEEVEDERSRRDCEKADEEDDEEDSGAISQD